MINTLILYGVSSLAVTIIPGPTMLLALSNGTTKKGKVVLMGILGAACSDFILIGLVAVGLGAILAASETLFSVIKFIGVFYLFWLAYSLWVASPSDKIFSGDTQSTARSTSLKATFLKSLFAALSNPKGLLFFSAFLPQFIHPQASQVSQYLSFALITVAIDMLIMAIYAAAGFQISRYLSAIRLKIMNRLCSLILVFMASGLAIYRRAS